MMNISQIAKLTRLSTKSIRFYEQKGLISAPARSASGYRQYSDKHLEELLVIARAKRVGFTLDECKALVNLAMNPETTSAEVRQKAEEKLGEVRKKIQELSVIEEQLEKWVVSCPGDSGHSCPIIDDLKG